MSAAAGTFAAVFAALYVAHSVGDHWVQTSAQSAVKGRHGWTGRLADTRHVLTLTATKLAVLLPAGLLLGLHLSVWGLAVGLGVDAVTHWWADRRSTLARFAALVGKGEFYSLGTPAHPRASGHRGGHACRASGDRRVRAGPEFPPPVPAGRRTADHPRLTVSFAPASTP